MSFGIKALNEHGYTQIDQDYQNLVLIAEGTVRTGQWVTYPAVKSPMVVVGPNPSSTVYRFFRHEPGNNRFSMDGGTLDTRIPEYAFFDYQYRVYAPAGEVVSPTKGTYGLKVLTPHGLVAFHSDNTYLKVKQASVVTAAQVDSGATTVSLPGTYIPFVSVHGLEAAIWYWVDPDADYYSSFAMEVKTTKVTLHDYVQGPANFYKSRDGRSDAIFPVIVTTR